MKLLAARSVSTIESNSRPGRGPFHLVHLQLSLTRRYHAPDVASRPGLASPPAGAALISFQLKARTGATEISGAHKNETKQKGAYCLVTVSRELVTGVYWS